MLYTLFASAHYGWLVNVKVDGGKITGFSWTRNRGCAGYFPDALAEEIHRALNDRGIAHDVKHLYC